MAICQEKALKEAVTSSVRKPARPRAARPVAAAADVSESLDRRALLAALKSVAAGDFSVRLPGHWTGIDGRIADHFNDIVAANQHMSEELARVGEVVGKQGKTQQRARFSRNPAAWGAMQDSVNTLI